MKASVTFLFASLTILLINLPCSAQGTEWETHYSKAEKAYAKHNLFEARREFMVALKEAEDCKQHQLLAQKLESLADSYQTQENPALAQPLFKLARKLKSKFNTI